MKFLKKTLILIFSVVLIGCKPMMISTDTEICEFQKQGNSALITVNDSEFLVEVNETDFTDSFIIDFCKNNYSISENISCIEFIDDERNLPRSGSYEKCKSCYYVEVSDKLDTHRHWVNLFTVKDCTRRTRVCACLICGKKVTTVVHLY